MATATLDQTLERMEYGRALKHAILMNRPSEDWIPYARPLLDAANLFDELHIGYALIGGIAAMYYGRPRFTEDVDFVAATGHLAILSANPTVMEKHHFEPSCTFKLYHRSGVSIDIWKDEHANDIIGRSIPVEVADRTIQLIEPHDLVAMKLRGGRLKDDYDIGEILRSNRLDRDRLAGLVVPDHMRRFDEIARRSAAEMD